MFGLFRRKSKRGHVSYGRVFEGVNAAETQTPQGNVPGGDMATRRFGEPAPEYIAEATTPSEELWAREQASYRAKNGPKDD